MTNLAHLVPARRNHMVRRAAFVLLLGAAGGTPPQPALAQSADPMEGRVVRAVNVTGLRNVSSDTVERHLATRVGDPFHRANLPVDQRRLDELRLFAGVTIEPRLENEAVVLQVAVTETLRLLPTIGIRVTDENGFSIGFGMKGINLLGYGSQSGASLLFGGETSVSTAVETMTITPGTWTRRFAFSYSDRPNTLYDFDEQALSAEARTARNLTHGLRVGGTAGVLAIDTGSSGAALSEDGRDVMPTLGGFVTVDTLDSSTNPRAGTWAEAEVDRLFGDASSWTIILDGRRFQRLSDRHGLGLFSLASFQTGEVGVDLPEYRQFALGGGNTVRGWSLGSQRGRNQYLGTVDYSYVLRPVQAFSVAGLNLYAGLQLVGFGDIGLAWNDDVKAAPAIGGYGVGLRALVPFVDVIRLDLAWGEPGRGATAYIGVSLKAARQRQRVR